MVRLEYILKFIVQLQTIKFQFLNGAIRIGTAPVAKGEILPGFNS